MSCARKSLSHYTHFKYSICPHTSVILGDNEELILKNNDTEFSGINDSLYIIKHTCNRNKYIKMFVMFPNGLNERYEQANHLVKAPFQYKIFVYQFWTSAVNITCYT